MHPCTTLGRIRWLSANPWDYTTSISNRYDPAGPDFTLQLP
jgi:hypothetical protein